MLLLRLPANQFVDLHEFDFLDGEKSFNIIEKLIAGDSKVKLAPVVDSRDESSNKLSVRLRHINRRANFLLEETGAFDLYVGWPFVHGRFSDGSIIRAPLMFFPVRLNTASQDWQLEVRKDVNISLNKTFLLAYAHHNQVELEENLIERTFDDFDRDSRAFRNSLYELIKESGIELNFNQDLFNDTLISFRNYKKSEFQESTKDGELKLFSEAVLGILPQADSYLIPDYDYLLERNQFESLEDFFYSKTIDKDDHGGNHSYDYTYFLNKVKEEQTFAPLRMDAYQENALKAVKRGNSLVVQGPPGTGKSQLICNLISDYLARGKKVLVVCQKRVALDVVYNRLKEIEIDDFIALVHDFKNDRREIYEKIAGQIERVSEYQRSNNSLDTVQLERDFQQSSRSIDQITEELEEYRSALFDESECGVSIKELYLNSDPDRESVSLTQEYLNLPIKDIEIFEKELRNYLAYAHKFNLKDHPWSDRVDFAGFKLNDLKLIQKNLDEIPKYANDLIKEVSSILDEAIDYDSCRTLSENLDKMGEMTKLLRSEELFGFFRDMVPFQNEITEGLWLKNTSKLIDNCYDEFGVESSISSNEIGEIQTILKRRSSAKKSFIESFKWYFSKEKTRLARILIANDLRDDRPGLDALTKRIDNRLNLQHQLTKLRTAEWIKVFPDDLLQENIQKWFGKIELALEAKLLFSSFANFKEYFNLQKLTLQEFKEKIKQLSDALNPLPEKRKDWNKYILPRQIDLLLASESNYSQLKNSIKKDFDSICELDKLKSGFSESGVAVLDKLDELEGYSIDKKVDVFLNSLRLAWIDHIESKYEILRSVSTLKFDQMIQDLQMAVDKKLQVSNQILIQKARENTYDSLEYNRLNNRVTYRDLEHQVGKKRRIWPLRRLVANYADEIFHLIPCWMASPESVSAIFPLENFFDLVIFDEASQCFAEKGLPAMYRAKQVVVTGDDNQLPPNDLYKVRWEDETEGIEYEVDSLLQLTSRYFIETQLKGHYRSNSPDLVQFSNDRFYKGTLKLLPHVDRMNAEEPGIHYMKVDGLWEGQANKVEAETVLNVIRNYYDQSPGKSIGVVTFNATQQHLIQDMIERDAELNRLELFVKNIENVQGDERDLIIFSIGYGPDQNGEVKVQFGNLNIQGGENRLNVAVTRAKEKIVVVSSIDPSELDVVKSKNEGPRLLKDYLQYAKDVSEGRFKYQPETADKNINWYLKYKLIETVGDKRLSLSVELPFGDLTAKSGVNYHALILTDDNLYFASPSEKETFVYSMNSMEEKGWKYRFVHSRNYWLDKERMKENLNRFLGVLPEENN